MCPEGESSVYMSVWVVFPVNSTSTEADNGRSDLGEYTTGNGELLFPKYRSHQKIQMKHRIDNTLSAADNNRLLPYDTSRTRVDKMYQSEIGTMLDKGIFRTNMNTSRQVTIHNRVFERIGGHAAHVLSAAQVPRPQTLSN